MKSLKLVFINLVLAGCAGVGAQQFNAEGITLGDEGMVKDCKFLGDVTGLSSFYGLFSGPAYASARKLAVEQAQQLGATHVVFTGGSSHYGGTEAFGRAYKCPASDRGNFNRDRLNQHLRL
jgi:hypothetical protein